MIKNVLRFLLVALFLFLPCLTFAEDPKPTTTASAYGAMEFKAGEIIVRFKKGISQASVQSLLLAEDVNILDEMDNIGLLLLRVPKGRELEKIEELKRNPLVEYAEPNYIVQAANTIAAEPHYSLRALDITPNDPYCLSGAQWNLGKIEAPVAWDITTGSDRIVIAVIDTGVDLDHPELKDKIWTNSGEIPDNDFDDDGNGYVDDVHGWDFVTENWDNEPQDDFGIGTFVATVAAAETDNGYGIAGVSWGAEIMPVKVLDRNGSGAIYEVTTGIEYAADNGANVLILDFQLFYYVDALKAAIDYAYYQKGALLVAPMGDCAEGKDLGRCDYLENPVIYPAAFPQVVAVAATGQNDEPMFFSGHKSYVDVAAPGERIPGFWLDEEHYAQYSSTAFATPHVAGLAALIWSVNPTLTNDAVEEIIESTAVDLGEPGRDEYSGHGRIDAGAAVMTTTHHLEVEPDDGLYFLVCDDCDPPSRKITNPNTNCSTWSATATASWLSISSCEDYTPSWVTVSINRDSLPGYGLHTAPITATSTMTNYVNNPITITATAIYPSQCWRNYLPLLFKGS